MKYIADLNKLKYLQNSDKQEDKDFLLKFLEMPDDEANEYLSKISLDDNEESIKASLEFLIKDELEAIDGYNKVLKLLDVSDGKGIKPKLEKIIKDEEEHIEILKNLLGGK